MKNPNYKVILSISILALLLFSMPVFALAEMHVSGQTSYTLGWSTTDSLSVTVYCDNEWFDCYCTWHVDDEEWSSYRPIENEDSYTTYITATTPAKPNKDQITYTFTAACYDTSDSDLAYDSLTIRVNYPTDLEWNQYQAEQAKASTASSEISTATNLISDANSEISKAESKITEASNLDADVTSAQSSLTSARSLLSTANSYLSQAKTAYSSANYDSAISKAEDAQTSANSAKTKATQAYNSANDAIEKLSEEKIEASNKISDALSAIDTAEDWIEKTDGLINNATIAGIDTAQSEADVATARSKASTARSYYSEASTAFSNGNYDSAKSKAASAKSNANSAESLASSAYNTLWKVYVVAREAVEAVAKANTEVSQMNQIMTNMDAVVRGVEKWGVDLGNAKATITTAKQNVDNSEDLLSQATIKLQSGYYTEAVNLADSSREKAATSKNRLDTIVSSISVSVLDALEAAQSNLDTKLSKTESEVNAAANAYGADASEVVAAQNDLKSAKTGMSTLAAKINNVERADDLTTLLDEASAAFSTVDTVESDLKSASKKANAAKMGLYTKVGAGAAVVAGGVGGGFLYWRKKKKGKGKKPKKKTEKIIIEACAKCGATLHGLAEFCHKCGEAVKKEAPKKELKKKAVKKKAVKRRIKKK